MPVKTGFKPIQKWFFEGTGKGKFSDHGSKKREFGGKLPGNRGEMTRRGGLRLRSKQPASDVGNERR